MTLGKYSIARISVVAKIAQSLCELVNFIDRPTFSLMSTVSGWTV